MDKKQAQNIVKETFENAFDEERFRHFVRNLLNHIEEEDKHPYSGQFIPADFQNYISTFKRIGKYSEGEHEIDILVVQLKKETTLERARTAQRNFIARYLNGSRGGKMKDAALVAFVSPNDADWRFSLIKMDYKFIEGKSGKTKVKEEFTPARRWSFLVGPHEHSHTAQAKLVQILEDENVITLARLEKAFNIESVTKEFFEKYHELFLKVKENLDEIVLKDKKIKDEFKNKETSITDFAKKLLGQIVFLYFLQKKGWFGVRRGQDWGFGSKSFLRELFNKKHSDYKNFFNDILEPLFYEALRNDRSHDDHYFSMFKCKIPFLNGGLFDPINAYDWKETDILLSNELFSNENPTREGDVGDGILDIFDRYNFTVKEDEPLEKEVAVDPEMLGKVFENLLEVKDRKSKGTYYTPREIVHYMCQESLINYLYTELNQENIFYQKIGERQLNILGNKGKKSQLDLTIEHRSSIKISREDVETLIKYGETVIEHETEVESLIKETKTYSYKLSRSIRDNARLIDENLTTIRVCDPAVGSGAFLVGMMNEIMRTRNALTPYIGKDGERTPYNFKRHAIQNCLYGVDIDLGAVEIAKLRLWLSLIVDEDDIEQIRPLPNLDYKIMQGNGLLEEYEDINFYGEYREGSLFDAGKDDLRKKQLAKKKIEYFQETKPIRKKELRAEITSLFAGFVAGAIFRKEKSMGKSEFKEHYGHEADELVGKLSHPEKEKPFFLWRIYFSEVFEDKNKKGFDVVIANPPYIRHRDLDKNIKDTLTNIYKTGNTTSDIYCYFYELSYNLLHEKGVSTLITSNKWMRAKYGEQLRVFFKENVSLLVILDLGGGQFDSATADTNILIFRRQKPENNSYIKCGKAIPSPDEVASVILQDDLNENAYTFLDKEEIALKKKIDKVGTKLMNWNDIKINYGILTGRNEVKINNKREGVFIIDEHKRNELIQRDDNSKKLLMPILMGKNIYRYGYVWDKKYLVAVNYNMHKEIDNYPAIKNHLTQYKRFLQEKSQVKRGDHHWIELDQNPSSRYMEEFNKDKIAWGNISDESSFCFNKEMAINAPANFITSESVNIKYILAIMNSKIFFWEFKNSGITLGNAFEWKIQYVKNIHVPQITNKQQKPFIEIVDKILVITKTNDYLNNSIKQTKVKEYEKQIDQMVYKLYGLMKEEIKIIEKYDR